MVVSVAAFIIFVICVLSAARSGPNNAAPSMKDRVTRLCILLVLQVLELECACGGEVTTKFEKNATLTDQQLRSVIQLARECGLTEPAEVSIGHTRPLNR